ncbi:MAG: restriction endonuclease subunit S [Cyanobium sp.]
MRSKWTWRHLGDVAHIEMGQSPPSEHVSEQSDAGLPFLQGNADFSALHPHPQLWCKKPLKSANRGDILISVRAPVGAINLADQSYCIGRGLGKL